MVTANKNYLVKIPVNGLELRIDKPLHSTTATGMDVIIPAIEAFTKSRYPCNTCRNRS